MTRWLKRKWCEWSHVHSWGAAPGQKAADSLTMVCKKCGRAWMPFMGEDR